MVRTAFRIGDHPDEGLVFTGCCGNEDQEDENQGRAERDTAPDSIG